MTDPIPDYLRIDPGFVIGVQEAFLRSELGRTGLEHAVIGLSGGVDSAVAAALTARALGPERTHLVLMPHVVSSQSSVRDAKTVAEVLGAPLEEVPITEMTRGMPGFDELDRVRAGNVMARLRMIVLFDRSAEHRALVIGTSNKTELLLGYGTLHGDMASAINPVGDLYKTQLRQLAPSLGIPEHIRVKAPSADLWEGQTDEGELGVAYSDADAILYHLADLRMSAEQTAARGFDASLVERLWERVRTNEYKRHLPVICKLSERTVGADWLYPRDWGT